MGKLLGLFAIGAGILAAQTAETIPFRAIMLPSNEVPAININANGAATIWLHVVRGRDGQVMSASTDFNVTYSFPGDVTLTGLHIHKGNAGENGPVTIDTGISGTNSISSPAGSGAIVRQAQTVPSNAAGLDTVNGMLTNPSGFYVNLHSTVNPGGVIRGQLQRADMVVLYGLMSPKNEIPAITDTNASGVGSIVALATRDANGAITSGLVTFDINYSGFADGLTFTGLHVHTGAASVNGPVTIGTPLAAANNITSSAAGGNLHYDVEVPVTNAAAVSALDGLFTNPAGYYVNVHTSVNPGGVARGQLRRTDKLRFPVNMVTANEVPPITSINANAPALVDVYTLRNDDGSVNTATVIFDVNFRFPGADKFTGLHIHNGKAGENGPVTVNTGINGAAAAVETATGQGNIYRVVNVSSGAALATVNSLVMNPENHYINLHTETNPGGVVRSQLAAPNTSNPRVNAVISAISDPARTAVAPLGLMTVFGTNLVKVPSDLLAASDGVTVPRAFNGAKVTIGGKDAPLLVVTPAYIVAQVPSDVAAGSQALTVSNANGASNQINATVAAVAPAIFFDANGGLFLRNADFTLVGANNRARAGDVVVFYSTGNGATTPVLQAGQTTPGPGSSNTFYQAGPTTVTVGGRDAQVIYSLASPGFVGLYQTAIMIPAGAGTGSVPVKATIRGVDSNTVNIMLQ